MIIVKDKYGYWKFFETLTDALKYIKDNDRNETNEFTIQTYCNERKITIEVK